MKKMDETICNCAGCGGQHPQSELSYRPSDIYPYRCKYYCTSCCEQKDRRTALKTAKVRAKKPSRTSYSFKY